MTRSFSLVRLAAIPGILAFLLLTACNNQYGPPVKGKPVTWAQQHYLDNLEYQRLTQDRLNR